MTLIFKYVLARLSSQPIIFFYSTIQAIKNPIELEGFENCHIRDGAALCQFFAWLEKEVPKGYVTEMIASDKLFEIRSLMSRFMGPSFETISAGGE